MIDERRGDCLLEELQAGYCVGPGLFRLGNPYRARTAICMSHTVDGGFSRSSF